MAGLNSIFTPLQNLPWEAQLAGMAVIGGWKVVNYIDDKKQVDGVRKNFQDKFSELRAQSYTQPQEPSGDTVWSNTIPVSLFARTGESPSVADITFDMVVEENHKKTATVSEHPVEESAPITDHIQVDLRTLTMKALVSNFSVRAGSLSGDSAVDNRASSTWKSLTTLVDKKQLVNVVSGLEKYADMAIVSVSTERKANTGDALEFDIVARQVRVVRVRDAVLTSVVKYNAASATQRQAAKKVDPGAQSARDATSKKAKSVVMDKLGIITRPETATAVGTDKGAIKLFTDATGSKFVP